MFSKENIATYAKNYEYIFEDREKEKIIMFLKQSKTIVEELASKLENFDKNKK
ncbi:hypothetical protein CM15mP35_09650 [bacterium]|nr:MAG: hypothetical protein CM15mP35_09650 [bacterium]